jgi:hypothetical protein
MRRAEVSHILRAARSLTNETEFVLVGSQAAHVSIADLPEVMQQSGELDIYPLRQPELADVIERLARGLRFTLPSATTHKVWDRRPPSCRVAGATAPCVPATL